jgi:hypothetical protein
MQRRSGQQAVDGGRGLIEADSTPSIADFSRDRQDSFFEPPFEPPEPAIQRTACDLIASPDQLDTSPDLADHEDTEEDRVVFESCEPASHVGVAALALPNLRQDVRVE